MLVRVLPLVAIILYLTACSITSKSPVGDSDAPETSVQRESQPDATVDVLITKEEQPLVIEESPVLNSEVEKAEANIGTLSQGAESASEADITQRARADPSVEIDTTATSKGESIELSEVAGEVADEVVIEAVNEVGIDVTEPLVDPAVKLCEEVGAKLGSVSVDDCLQHQLVHSAYTKNHRSLAYKDFEPLRNREPLGRVLVIGGIHGDEFSSVSVIVKWMEILDQYHSGLFHWRFVPTLNPDGLLGEKSQRQNANGVDLNRNFPTSDWDEHAISHWQEVTKKNPRRDPGVAQASELETKWLVSQIEEFKPDVIISMHAPYHLVDYDGPPAGPKNLGNLYLRKLGVFPGSLGNYVGLDLNKPIVTVELKSAGIMPAEQEINRMWSDLVRWLRDQLAS